MVILEIKDLSKNYGSIKAVDQLNLQVEQGQVMGILGPNGSGKTTTLGMILGIIHPDSGSYSWFGGKYGHDERLHIGALLETPNFYPYLSAEKNLEIVAHIKHIQEPELEKWLRLVDLYDRRKSNFRTFSFGMKQRLAIAAAMVGDPEVLIFDEPTNGLDPQGIAEVREIIQRIAGEGKTIIMASHILDEVEKVCSHVAIIKKGKLLAVGAVGNILSNDRQVEIQSENMEVLHALLKELPGVHKIELKNGQYALFVDERMTAAELNQLAFDRGIVLSHLVMKSRSLESEFLEITR